MRRSSLIFSFLYATSMLSAVFPLQAQNAGKLQQQFRYQYEEKTLLLRNFYSGSELSYSATGELTSQATPGDWTVDGVVKVIDLSLKHQQLTIQARRLYLAWYGQGGFQYLDANGNKKDKKDKEDSASILRIRIDFGADEPTAEKINAVLSRVFLTDQDSLLEAVPNYWKTCISAALTGKEGKLYYRCKFSPEFTATPGVVFHSGENPKLGADTGAGEVPTNEIMHLAKANGITPPKAVFSPDPGYNDAARREKYQGTGVLDLVVDKTGGVRNVQVMFPLGCGLDEQAVNTVRTWRFDPATKDGQPVAVELNIEIDFRLN